MTMRVYEQIWRVLLVITAVVVCDLIAVSQTRKPILLLFHGVDENRDSMRELAQVSFDAGMFSKVVVIGYNWQHSKIAEDAPRIFGSVTYKFPDKDFVLLGSKEG